MVRSRTVFARLAFAVVPLVVGCAALPKVEIKAYTTAYTETQVVSNGVLDIVAPYERVVIRYAAKAKNVTRAAPAVAAPAIDPSLLANPNAAPRPPRPATTPVVFERSCRNGYNGPDPYCFEYRDGYADIGDPPLVGAFRNLSDIVARFNALLVAYADGVSAKLIEQDLNSLSASITTISSLAPISSISGAAGFATRFNNIVGRLVPIAEFAGPIADRAAFRNFLLANYELVDEAIELMATSSPTLYANVAVGTQLFRITARGVGESMNTRRREIRRLIANWTVLLDDNRRLLRELKFAIENSDALETRLRSLNDSTIIARIDTSAIKKQIATLGTPVLPP